jgi:arylsulfatase A-like enzyme
MKEPITRRDFLKLAGVLPLSFTAPNLVNSLSSIQQTVKPENVIIVVLDAFSASNISLYGYQRETTPNLARLAERAIVYHHHYAGGNFTTSGTAALLTGTLPWTNRAFLPGGTVEEGFVNKTIFSAFQNYYRLAYSHNGWANILLKQFRRDLDNYIAQHKFFLTSERFLSALFGNDEDIASVSWLRITKKEEEKYAYSLYLSHLYELYRERYWKSKIADLDPLYPRGVPGYGTDNFLLEQAIDAIADLLITTPQPFLGYFHFMPPHAPYKTHRDFYKYFSEDGYEPMVKPLNPFSTIDDPSILAGKRTSYDEFILYADREFGRFIDNLESIGLLENTWVVLTSDHGEMFERGLEGHGWPVLYQPVIRVPLMIFEPGQRTRRDVHVNTSSVDLLPTLLHVTGQKQMDWFDGKVLPPFGKARLDPDQSHYVIEASKNKKKSAPLTTATVALIKGSYKLTYSFGYTELAGVEGVELYDIEKDPEELNDLYAIKRETAGELLGELKAKLTEMDEPYQ